VQTEYTEEFSYTSGMKLLTFITSITLVLFTGCTQVVTAPISIAGAAVSATVDVAGSVAGAAVNVATSGSDDDEDKNE